MSDNQLADTEAHVEVDTAKNALEEQLRALAAIHGGFGEDLLPGLPGADWCVDDEVFGDREWPHGWVAA